jgi:hypothetical protein
VQDEVNTLILQILNWRKTHYQNNRNMQGSEELDEEEEDANSSCNFYAVKICGTNEYILGETKVGSVQYFRKCLHR